MLNISKLVSIVAAAKLPVIHMESLKADAAPDPEPVPAPPLDWLTEPAPLSERDQAAIDAAEAKRQRRLARNLRRAGP